LAIHNGCLVVAAAGNTGLSGNPAIYPAAYPHVLTVGATDQNDAPAPFFDARGDTRRCGTWRRDDRCSAGLA